MEKKDVFEMEFKEITDRDIDIDVNSFTDEENKQAIQNASLDINAVLGAKTLTIREILEIKAGEVIWLKKTIDEPVCLMSNNSKIADAETTTLNGKLAVKVIDF